MILCDESGIVIDVDAVAEICALYDETRLGHSTLVRPSNLAGAGNAAGGKPSGCRRRPVCHGRRLPEAGLAESN
jgi:hypothetical protein